MLSSDRADGPGCVHPHGQLGADRDRPPFGGDFHGGVGDPVPFRPTLGDVAVPRGSLRCLRQHVPRASPPSRRLRRAYPEPRGMQSDRFLQPYLFLGCIWCATLKLGCIQWSKCCTFYSATTARGGGGERVILCFFFYSFVLHTRGGAGGHGSPSVSTEGKSN